MENIYEEIIESFGIEIGERIITRIILGESIDAAIQDEL